MPPPQSASVSEIERGLGREPRRRPDADDAVRAAGEGVPLEHDRPRDLRERERQHREVDPGQPHAEPAEDRGADRRHDRRRRERRLHRPGRLLQQQPRAVGAEPEVGGVAERHHAARPHDEVQARGEEREHQDVDAEHERIAAGRERQRGKPRNEDDGGGVERPRRRPQGRLDVRRRRALDRPGLAEEPLGPQHQHDRHDDELCHQGQLRERERVAEELDRPDADAERLDAADQQRGEERARDAAHAADDHHHERVRDRAEVEEELRRLARNLQRAAEPGEEPAEREHAGEEPLLVHAERADHLAILGRRADQRAPPGAVEEEPERPEHQRPDRDQEEVVLRERDAEDLDRAAQARRSRPEQILGAPDPEREILDDEREREGREELEELRRVVDPPQDRRSRSAPRPRRR